MRHERSITIFFTSIVFLFSLFALLFSFLWALLNMGPIPSYTSFWFLFSFLTGLMTIFLPCTLPLAFITVPLNKEKRTLRSLGMILLFALGVTASLAFYGGLLGAFGSFWVSLFPSAALSSITLWVYMLGGLFAYALALGELGLLSLRMPAYSGKTPEFIANNKGAGKMFFMGMFLGNIGVGCPFPAIPLLLISAIISGSPLYGILLFVTHAIGRILPLLVLLALQTVNINGLKWLTLHKTKFDRASGYVFVVFTALLMVFGAFAHGWFYQTTVYAFLSSLFPTATAYFFGSSLALHLGIFGSTYAGASSVFLFLILLPLWWTYFKERRAVLGDPVHQIKKLEREISHMLLELRGHEATLHIPEGAHHERVKELDRRIDVLLTQRSILEEGLRYGATEGLSGNELFASEREALRLRRNWYLTLSILLVLAVVTLFAPR